MLKDIVVNLSLRPERHPATSFAASMGSFFDAHLVGITFEYQPVLPATKRGMTVPTSFIDEQIAEAKKLAHHAAERLKSEIKRAGVKKWSVEQIEVSSSSAPRRFAEIARGFDIAVVAQTDPEIGGIDDLIAETTLFESGRPTVVVPYIQRNSFKLDHVAVCWDGSRPATRAIADAMPLLHRAGRIDLLSVIGERSLREEMPGAAMVTHLSRHGLKVNVYKMPMGEDVGSTILEFVSDAEVDLLVMGGYGHSRLREFILGGATRELLHSMTAPVLLAH